MPVLAHQLVCWPPEGRFGLGVVVTQLPADWGHDWERDRGATQSGEASVGGVQPDLA